MQRIGMRVGNRWILAPLWAFWLAVGTCAAWAADPYQAAAELRAQYAADIERLAKWCDASGMAEQAGQTRAAVTPQEPGKIFMPVLPLEVGPPKLPAGSPEKLVNWDKRLWDLRKQQSTKLYQMARQQVRSHREGLAFELMLDAIQADPDYAPVRQLLGYQKFRNEWRTLYEMKMLRSGMVFSDKFGWMSKKNLAKYEAGQRFSAGRWITAEEDAEEHHDIRTGWDVPTEHYTIRTDHSIEAAIGLSGKLENLCRLWREIFLPYYASEADVVALFEGKGKRAPAPTSRRKIVYFRDRDDYLETLKPGFPQVAGTAGVYRGGKACFYADAKKNDDRTLYHEATHQLFNESRPVVQSPGEKENFWIIEGIAVLMESLHQEDGYWVIGNYQDERLYAARVRLLRDKIYVPLDEFTSYPRERFQRDPRIGQFYSQAAGLTHFLVFYDGGRYRDALMAFLLAIYTGKDDHETLSKLTGETYKTLDAKYREFIEKDVTPQQQQPASK
jgi:hypothetical protein